jgi:hypothetical protein
MRRLGQLIDRADAGLTGRARVGPARSKREQAVVDALDLLLPVDMAQQVDVRTRPSGEVIVLVGSPAVLERVRALVPVLAASGRSAIDEPNAFAVTCTSAPGIVRRGATDSSQRPRSAVASLGPVVPGPDVVDAAKVISNVAVKAAFERWMASGLESRRRDGLT